MFRTGKIIEALATIKADTANHKEELKEFKETFANNKANANRKLSDLEDKTSEIDKKIAEDISILKTRSKYNLLSMAGIWTVIGVVLKKLFMP